MITSDWHIHSHHSCDGACMTLPTLLRRTAELGIRDFGLTDHVHTRLTLADIEASRRDYLACNPSPRFHFGIEVSCISQWELDEIAAGRRPDATYGLREGGPPGAPPAISITREDLDAMGAEYVVGGTHWPLYVPIERETVIRDYHRQNMFLAAHPLVDIVAHPWWWHKHWKDADGRYTTDPWFDDFGRIPASMHAEFAACAREHGAVIEINIGANLHNKTYPEHFKRQYLDYAAGLKRDGAALCVGSDCHSETYDVDFESASRMLESVGITDDDLWRLPPRAEG